MPHTSETRADEARASRNSLDSFHDAFSHSPLIAQLPPIISRHLWRPDELAVIEATAMVAIVWMGGVCHG